MNKRFLIVAGALLVLGSAAAFLFNRYANSTTTLPVATEKDFREAARKWADAEQMLAPSAAPIDLSKPVRLAIGSLGLPDEKENLQLGTLVAARLSRTPGLVLVERQELDQVLREMQRSLSGLVRAADAVRVGKLLKADWFLLGNSVRLEQTNFIVARIVDAKSGVMQDLALLGDTDRPLLIAEALASFARRVRETAARPALKEFLAIGQFADAGVNDRQAS